MPAQYIAPAALPSPDYDQGLEDLFQRVLVGITALDPKMVRPRWQPEPPNMPDFEGDWLAFGITTTDSDTYAFLGYDRIADSYKYERNETIKVLCSFYGPGGGGLLSRWKDGLQIPQNRYELMDAKIGFTSCTDGISIPALLKQRWVRRSDCSAYFKRLVVREYPVPIMVGRPDGISLDNEHYVTEINTSTNPNP